MRPSYALWLLGLSIAGSGCALFEDTARNLVVGVKAPIEAHREKARNRRWAETAWQEVCMKGGAHTADFGEGFKDGFAEYLYRGGDGEPPLVAPLRYRDIRYQNAQGYQAIQDWFSGYRQGAAMARDSGARSWITGPSALQTGAPEAPPQEFHQVVPEYVPPVLDLPPPTPAPQPLPKEAREPIPAGPVRIDFGAPLGTAAPIVAVPAGEEPGPLKIKITKVNGTPAVMPEPESEPEAAPEPVRLKITKVSEAPAVDSEPSQVELEPALERSELPEPIRQRIRAILTPPSKD